MELDWIKLALIVSTLVIGVGGLTMLKSWSRMVAKHYLTTFLLPRLSF